MIQRDVSRPLVAAAAILALGSALQGQARLPRGSRGTPIPSSALVEGPGTVVSERKISSETGGFLDTLDGGDGFGWAVAALGDLDGDGVDDVAVGAPNDEDGSGTDATGFDHGAVWVLLLEPDGSVKEHRKINATQGGFGAGLDLHDGFGSALAALGDLDGDGVTELAVGAPYDDDGGGGASFDRGAVWVLFLAPDGSVKAKQKISAEQGGFGGLLDGDDRFGSSLAALGDLDGDGVTELAAGAPLDDDGGIGVNGNRGAAWVLFLESAGTVKAHAKISATEGGFSGILERDDRLGSALVPLGDLDLDGIADLAVGAPRDDDGGGIARGAVWVLFLETDGSVKSLQKISRTEGGFAGDLVETSEFGAALATLGDLDGDGVADLAVGAPGDPDGGGDAGASWILFLNPDGTVRAHQKVSALQGGFGGELEGNEAFGCALASPGDLDGDGLAELAVGACRDDDGGSLWVLFLAADGTVRAEQKVSATEGGFPSTLDAHDSFGSSLVALGDVDGDGNGDFAAGAPRDDDGAFDAGAVWLLFTRADGSVGSSRKISLTEGGFGGFVDPHEVFGTAVAALGDLDGDGVPDLAAGAPTPNYSAEEWERGRVWVLFLNPDGSVKAERAIGNGQGGFGGALEVGDFFGSSLAPLGDLDGDGVLDLAVGAPGNGSAVWILFLDSDGTVKAEHEIPALASTFDPGGQSLAALGDLDRDGAPDLAIGSLGYAGNEEGSLSILFLESDGTVGSRQEISSTQGGFGGDIDALDAFGASLAALGDLDGDGVSDLAVGAPYDDDGGSANAYSGRGALWILFLESDGTVRAQQKISATQGGFGGLLDESDGFGSSLGALGDLDGDGLVELGVGAPRDDDGGYQHGALWFLALDGVATIDFERGDDYARTRLANGRALSTPGAFGRTLGISSAGANLGPATFDSTAGGPNDPGLDPDLLVELGNVLVLQDSLFPTQTVPGTFDRPGDDPDGGLVSFTFAGPVELLSIELVDIDSERGQAAKVILRDAAGRQRVYGVPAGWTEDLVTHGPPAFRRLDLATLEPQPGFRSTAFAAESPGFDARLVTRLDVGLARSGALDALRFDPHPLPRLARKR